MCPNFTPMAIGLQVATMMKYSGLVFLSTMVYFERFFNSGGDSEWRRASSCKGRRRYCV